jgi:hypothetical protein
VESARAITVALSVDAVVLGILGLILANVCGGGLSVIVFGVVVGVLGTIVARKAGLAAFVPTGILLIALVSWGLVLASGSGCF